MYSSWIYSFDVAPSVDDEMLDLTAGYIDMGMDWEAPVDTSLYCDVDMLDVSALDTVNPAAPAAITVVDSMDWEETTVASLCCGLDMLDISNTSDVLADASVPEIEMGPAPVAGFTRPIVVGFKYEARAYGDFINPLTLPYCPYLSDWTGSFDGCGRPINPAPLPQLNFAQNTQPTTHLVEIAATVEAATPAELTVPVTAASTIESTIHVGAIVFVEPAVIPAPVATAPSTEIEVSVIVTPPSPAPSATSLGSSTTTLVEATDATMFPTTTCQASSCKIVETETTTPAMTTTTGSDITMALPAGEDQSATSAQKKRAGKARMSEADREEPEREERQEPAKRGRQGPSPSTMEAPPAPAPAASRPRGAMETLRARMAAEEARKLAEMDAKRVAGVNKQRRGEASGSRR